MSVAIPTVYQMSHKGTAPKFNSAFAQGCGAAVCNDTALRPGPVALWGEHKWYKTLHRAIKEGRTWYYGDHAYFGRNRYYRITKNALQHTGVGIPDYERLRQVQADLREMPRALQFREDCHNPAGAIFVCPPSEALSERSGFRQKAWTDKVVGILRKEYPNPVVVRYKPKVNQTPAPLLDTMDKSNAWGVVTYTGNVAVEAAVAGYCAVATGPNPIQALGPGKLRGGELNRVTVAPVAVREAWASVLCANQWTLKEIAAGIAWKALNGTAQ